MKMVAESEIHGEEQGLSSVATVSTSPPISRSSPYQSLFERKLKEPCFRCGKQGHWAQDCQASSQPSTPPPDVHHFPVLRCHCGVACTLRVSRSDANYGRRYYVRNCNCDHVSKAIRPDRNFYKWCEDVEAPMCKCGAGACTINFQKDNDGNFTKYYTCRVRTGHGSCGFLLFDSPPSSWPRSMEIDKRPSILSPQHAEPPYIMNHDDESSVLSFSNRDMVVHEAETCNFAMAKGCHVSRLTSRANIRSRQIEFWNQISAAGNSQNGCKVLQIMDLHVHGWVGRLAFPPQILAGPPLRHFFCCIFPLFDPILVSEYVGISGSGSSSIMPHASSKVEADEVSQNAIRNDTQLLGVPLGTSSLKRSFTTMQEGVINPMLKEVRKNLRKDLGLLESMVPPHHQTMLQAANDTFDASASPVIECGPFAKRLMKSICCASRVAQMESTLQDNCNPQVPTIEQNIEKCLDSISGIHEEAFASNYIQSVPEVVSRFKDMLCQIGNLEILLLNIAKEVGQSKRSMQAAYQELTKALKLPQEEVEQCMARTTLDETSSEIYRLDGRKRQKIVELPE